ncbi:MAG: glycosyltransferase family 4 protein [Flavobacterium sp.]|nr:glycosyltransferase family 4 protein [Flavobacterium sp.]
MENQPKRKILFLGETYRADAITWINGLKDFGDFEIVTWELKTPSNGFFKRISRIIEYCGAIFNINKLVQTYQPDMVIAERTTSYGFLAALCGVQPSAIAQQGISDLWPENSLLIPVKKLIQRYAFRNVTIIHAWGVAMTYSMKSSNVDMTKVLVLPKGVDVDSFRKSNSQETPTINAIVTRSLLPEYRHNTIIKAFELIHQKGIDFTLTIVGDGPQLAQLKSLAKTLKIDSRINFTGRIPNEKLPELMNQCNFYISMPTTEGVSSSLFEAMAMECYPIVSDVLGNQCIITHRENGQLVRVDDKEMLANEIIWAFENPEYRKQVVSKNRKFVDENANYKINMKIIADRYHQLITKSKGTK